MRRVPYAHASLLATLDEHLNPGETIVIRAEGDTLDRWQRKAQMRYAPRRLVLAVPSTADDLRGTLGEMRSGPAPLAHRCLGTSCEAPLNQLQELERALPAV